MDHAREVARELDAAVEAGKRVTEAQLRERLGLEPQPADAIL